MATLADLRREKLERALPLLTQRLQLPGVKRILLFGSLATGQVGPGSDIDLIVVREDRRRFMERLEEVYRAIAEVGVAADVVVYTPEEMEELTRTRPFIQQALREGRTLYEA
ncbi:MAG: nucleotidyltransferase domain-containing protein [Myxococcota bacterium]